MSKSDEKIGHGKFVAFTYRLTNAADGSLLFEAKADAPDTMVHGVTREVVPGLQGVMEGLAPADKFSITLPPEVAFGERVEENVITLPASAFERDGKMVEEVKLGVMLPMLTEDGYTVTGKVIAIEPETVTMDFNHPFAGLTVNFDGEIVEVREATEEELHPKHACGCGCSHHQDDAEGGCGCHGDGDGCGCGCHGDGDGCGCHGDNSDESCHCGGDCACGDK